MTNLAAALREVKPIFDELSRTIEVLASPSDGDSCPSILIPGTLFVREPVEALSGVIGSRPKAERGELLRIDFDIDTLAPDGLKPVLHLLTRLAIGPEIKGIGEVVIRETREGLVVFLRDNSGEPDCHGATPCSVNCMLVPEITPAMIEAGADAFCTFDERFEDVEDVVPRIYRAIVTVSR